MSLNVTVNPAVSLPDLATVEAAAQAKIAEAQPLLDHANAQYAQRLADLGVTAEKVQQLLDVNPKLVDVQLRGYQNTARRFQQQVDLFSGLAQSYNNVKAKIDAGQTASMFEVKDRPWGHTRTRIYVVITDPDLLALHRAGVL